MLERQGGQMFCTPSAACPGRQLCDEGGAGGGFFFALTGTSCFRFSFVKGVAGRLALRNCCFYVILLCVFGCCFSIVFHPLTPVIPPLPALSPSSLRAREHVHLRPHAPRSVSLVLPCACPCFVPLLRQMPACLMSRRTPPCTDGPPPGARLCIAAPACPACPLARLPARSPAQACARECSRNHMFLHTFS